MKKLKTKNKRHQVKKSKQGNSKAKKSLDSNNYSVCINATPYFDSLGEEERQQILDDILGKLTELGKGMK